MMPARTRIPRLPNWSLSMMLERLFAGFLLYQDVYASRIATQTKSALLHKEYSTPLIISPIIVFPKPPKTPFLLLSDISTYTASRRANKLPMCNLLAMIKRYIGRPIVLCRVSSDFCRCLPPVLSVLQGNKYTSRPLVWLHVDDRC